MAHVKADVEHDSTEIPNAQAHPQNRRDEALLYLEKHGKHAISDEAYLKAIRTKIDWRVPPMLACCYLVQNLDKFALNVRRFRYDRAVSYSVNPVCGSDGTAQRPQTSW